MLLHFGNRVYYIPEEDDDYEIDIFLNTNNIRAPVTIYNATYRLGSEDEEIVAFFLKLLSSSDEEYSSDEEWSVEFMGCGGQSSYVNYFALLVTVDRDNKYRMYTRKLKVDNGSCYSPYDG